MFTLALFALYHLAHSFDYADVAAHVAALPASTLAAAVFLTALSYVALTGYDHTAIRHVGADLPWPTVALASFTAYAVSNSVGFSMLSGGSIRYRIYSAAGLGTGAIARVVAFCGLTFGLGLCAVGAVGLIVAPGATAAMMGVPPAVIRLLAAILILPLPAAVFGAAFARRPIRIGRFLIALPSPGIVMAQILIATADIVLAGAVLYILLPPELTISFPALLAIYSAALVVGLVSHVPGGLGVFETLILLGLSRGEHAASAGGVLGALIAFRAIYYLLPLVLAGVMLAGREVVEHRSSAVRTLRRVGGWTPRLVPSAGAAMVFIGGVVLLMSGATPGVPDRLLLVTDLMPLPVVEASHILGSMVGLGLLILARGLLRRLDAAWLLSVCLLAAGIVLSLAKGLDYEEAIILAVFLAVLLPCRAEFHRRATLTDSRFTPGWMLTLVGAVASSIWLTLFSFRHVEYANTLWWQFAVLDDAPRSLRAGFIVVLGVAAVSLAQLLRTSPPRPRAPTVEDIAKVRRILAGERRSDAAIALLGDKSFLFDDTGTAFLMYGVRGNSWVAMGDPVGTPEQQAELVWRFREMVDLRGGRAAFYQVSAETLPHYLDVGMSLLKLGEEARVDLPSFSLEGPAHKDLRYVTRRAERDGLSFEVVSKTEVPALIDDLAAISNVWLTQKLASEKRFSVGYFDPGYLREFDIAVVRLNGRIIAFANIWRGAPGGLASIDLMRYLPDLSPFTMDYLFTKLLLWAKDQGFASFSLGMAPLSGLEARSLAPLWNRIGALIFRRGENFYNFRGLRQYKQKFSPEWEPRYLACPGGIGSARVLTDATALISSGVRGVLAK
jgi:phosphatidylglycerol lysyltransferase